MLRKADLVNGSLYAMPRDIDQDMVDQAVLALLSLGRHEGDRTWKAFDWDTMNRLHPEGVHHRPGRQGEVGTFYRGRPARIGAAFRRSLSAASTRAESGLHPSTILSSSTVRFCRYRLWRMRKRNKVGTGSEAPLCCYSPTWQCSTSRLVNWPANAAGSLGQGLSALAEYLPGHQQCLLMLSACASPRRTRNPFPFLRSAVIVGCVLTCRALCNSE